MKSATVWLAKFFGHTPTEGTEALLIHGLQAILVMLGAVWLAHVLRNRIARHMSVGGAEDARQIRSYQRVAAACVLVPAAFVAIHILGIDLTPLFATGGVIALALGFGARTMAENLIAGVFLRLEKLASPGSVLELDGQTMTVKSIGARSIKADSYDGRDLIIANSDLLRSRIGTFTLSDTDCRISTQIRINYGADRDEARRVVQTALDQLDWVAEGSERSVTLKALLVDAALYEVHVWVDNPTKSWAGLNALNETIWSALSDSGIAHGAPELTVVLKKDGAPA